MLVLLGLLVFGLSFLSQLFVTLTLGGIGGAVGFMLIQSVIAAVIYSISAIFSALLYARLREIKEGIGMEGLVEVFA